MLLCFNDGAIAGGREVLQTKINARRIVEQRQLLLAVVICCEKEMLLMTTTESVEEIHQNSQKKIMFYSPA